jgi:NAD(P)H-dependent FMN reductase
LPLLNVDLFTTVFPKEIEYIRGKVAKCDALLFVSPEFFGKVSPALKNAYDWLSYSPDLQHPSPVRSMPAAYITVGEG